MSRDMFGDWGRDVSPEDFSAALAALAAYGPITGPPAPDEVEKHAREDRDRTGAIVPVHLTDVANGVARIRAGRQFMAARDYAQLWREFSRHVAPPEELCIEVDKELNPAESPTSVPDVFWLLRELARPGGAAMSVYLRDDRRDVPVAFELPLRFGLLEDTASETLATLVDGGMWRNLYQIVTAKDAAQVCDLLLLPYDLRTAASRILGQSLRKLSADCVLVMRGLGDVDTQSAQSLVAIVRDEVRANGVAILSLSSDRDEPWLNTLVRELSHDAPLLAALNLAQRSVAPRDTSGEQVPSAPVVIASRRLVQAARFREFARRLEGATRDLATTGQAPTLETVADDLAGLVEGSWISESGDATDVVKARRQAEERRAGTPIRVPRFGEERHQVSHARPPETRRGPETGRPPETRKHTNLRRVVLDLYDVTDPKRRSKVGGRLQSMRRYELELSIAAHDRAMVIASEPFPSEKLPAGDNLLSVYFIPLERAKNGSALPVQHKKLKLPAAADSKVCKFKFVVPASIATYRARIILSYRNRVLQTLILSAPVGETKGEFRLEPENVIDPLFESPKRHAGFDAAIIVNHSPGGHSGVTTVRDGQAVFAEPSGLDAMTDDLRAFILSNVALPQPGKKFDSEEMHKLIYTLSRKGKGLWDELPVAARSLLKDATRSIQIVDARAGAYFPAEFVYRGRSPSQGALACPNAAKALQCQVVGRKPSRVASVESHDSCTYRDDPKFTCPMRMWGFGLVIERQPPMGVPQPGFVLRDITDETASARTDVLDRVVVSVSNKVSQANRKAPAKLVASLSKVAKNVFFAKNWEELEKTIAKESPTLLVLLPHSDVDAEDPTIPTLELGGDMCSRDRLEEKYVRGPKADQPVVLLLGCETQTAEIQFLNFIKRFKDCGAAMVVGTITQIDALRTVDFVERFVGALAMANRRTLSLGEVLLETRRNMLAMGDGYALSLLAYGDTDRRS